VFGTDVAEWRVFELVMYSRSANPSSCPAAMDAASMASPARGDRSSCSTRAGPALAGCRWWSAAPPD
jgi:hypothetical protein